MKKNENKNTENKVFNAEELDFNTIESIFKNKNTDKSKTQYPLCKGVTLTIFDTDKDYDYGSLCIYGVYIDLTFRPSKKGTMFTSYPSVKCKNGEYKNVVNNYSKNLNQIIKDVLDEHYSR